MKKNYFAVRISKLMMAGHHGKLLNSVAALFFLIFISAVFFFLYLTVKDKKDETSYYSSDAGEVLNAVKLEDVKIENQLQKKQKILGSIDSRDWEIYENKWYGFQIKYPGGWEKPIAENPSAKAKWEYKLSDFN